MREMRKNWSPAEHHKRMAKGNSLNKKEMIKSETLEHQEEGKNTGKNKNMGKNNTYAF